MQGRGFPGHHVGIELWRPAHGLAGVVDDEVQARTGGQQLAAERLHAGRVAQIQAVYLQAMAPFGEVRLFGVTGRRVTREARGHDQLGAGTQQFEAGLVADLDPAASQQRDAAAQVGGLGALDEVQLGAAGAHLVVEVVQLGELLLAHVAMAQFRRMHRFGRDLHAFAIAGVMQPGGMRREIVRRTEHRLAAQGADAGLFEQGLGLAHLFLVALLGLLLEHRPARLGLGVVDLGHHLVQAGAVGVRQGVEHAAVGLDRLQQVQRGAQAIGQGQVVGVERWGDGIQCGSGEAVGRQGGGQSDDRLDAGPCCSGPKGASARRLLSLIGRGGRQSARISSPAAGPDGPIGAGFRPDRSGRAGPTA
ncbi:hypothetical protein D3C71_1048560 [compost metagenome]